MKPQLVDAIRMLERAGIIDHNGHCSARRDADAFYINSGAAVRGGRAELDDDCVFPLPAGPVSSSSPDCDCRNRSSTLRAAPA